MRLNLTIDRIDDRIGEFDVFCLLYQNEKILFLFL